MLDGSVIDSNTVVVCMVDMSSSGVLMLDSRSEGREGWWWEGCGDAVSGASTPSVLGNASIVRGSRS